MACIKCSWVTKTSTTCWASLYDDEFPENPSLARNLSGSTLIGWTQSPKQQGTQEAYQQPLIAANHWETLQNPAYGEESTMSGLSLLSTYIPLQLFFECCQRQPVSQDILCGVHNIWPLVAIHVYSFTTFLNKKSHRMQPTTTCFTAPIFWNN